MNTPKNVQGLKPWDKNPRHIPHVRREALRSSMANFGDISGIVYNLRTDSLVCGHQRVSNLPPDAKVMVHELADGTPLSGVILDPEGGEWPIRFVDWDESKQAAAAIVANSREIQGDWRGDEVVSMLEELTEELGELALELRLPELHDGLVTLDEPDEKPQEKVKDDFVELKFKMTQSQSDLVLSCLGKVKEATASDTFSEALVQLCEVWDK